MLQNTTLQKTLDLLDGTTHAALDIVGFGKRYIKGGRGQPAAVIAELKHPRQKPYQANGIG